MLSRGGAGERDQDPPDTSIQAPLGATSAQRRLWELRAGLARLQVGLAPVGGTAGFDESAAPPLRRCAAAGLSRFSAVFLRKTREGETPTPSRSVLSAAPRQTLRNEGSTFERPAFLDQHSWRCGTPDRKAGSSHPSAVAAARPSQLG